MRMVALLLAWGAAAAAAGEPMAVLSGFGGETLRAPVVSMQRLRTERTVLQQYDFSCGSAAIATLLTHHYGRAVGEQEVLDAMYATGDQEKIRKEGFSLLDMKRYLQGIGYTADGFQKPLEKLAEARLPAIVLVNEGNYRHFVVIKGLREGRVLIGDPARGTRSVRRSEFEEAWVGKLLFVIHDHVQEARFNVESDWRAAPSAPMPLGVQRDGVMGSGLPRNGPGDF